MLPTLYRRWPWILLWCLVTAIGCLVLGRLQLGQIRDAFETDARIAHRLLSQRAVQHDAVMAMLALMQTTPDVSQPASAQPEQRLPSVYPQITGVQRREVDATWPDERLAKAETVSRALKRPVLAVTDFARGRYQLVLASDPASYSLQMDVRAVVPWSEWPMAPETRDRKSVV